MRVALFEMHHREEVPAEVAIDEAVNLAKEYCGADAPGFVNGILGAAVAGDRVRGRRDERPGRRHRARSRLACASSPSSCATPTTSPTSEAEELAREAAELAAEAGTRTLEPRALRREPHD